MITLLYCLTIFTIMGLYYGWRAYHQSTQFRNQRIRERVAFMLWVAATQVSPNEPVEEMDSLPNELLAV